MRKILVTAISGDVANSILKILKETDDEVYGCDIYDFPVGMDKVKCFWKVKLAKHPDYISELIEGCRKFKITHLIPTNEQEIKVISDARVLFEDIGIKIVINSKYIIDTFLDKYSTYVFLNGIREIDVPKTYSYTNFVEDGNKYIVKYRSSCGSKFLKIIETKKELDALDIVKEDVIIQEYIEVDNEEYTVGAFSAGKETHVIIFKRKLEHGHTSFVELVKDKEIEKISRIIAEEIKLKGFINIQLRKKDNKNYIFEINPRISGTANFRHKLEFMDVIWWLDYLDGKMDFEYHNNYKKAIGMRELSEKFVSIEKFD